MLVVCILLIDRPILHWSLAGSERIAKSEVAGQQLKEAQVCCNVCFAVLVHGHNMLRRRLLQSFNDAGGCNSSSLAAGAAATATFVAAAGATGAGRCMTRCPLPALQAINKSLSALGDVIASLQSKNGHVPYRNSRLTQVGSRAGCCCRKQRQDTQHTAIGGSWRRFICK